MSAGNIGTISRISGPVVDVHFPEHSSVPDIFHAVEVTINGSTTPYTDIDAAFAAAQQAGSATVKLLADVTTTSEIEVDSGTFTIDLNGKTWHVYEDVNSNIIHKIPLTVTGSSVTLKNGTISGNVR